MSAPLLRCSHFLFLMLVISGTLLPQEIANRSTTPKTVQVSEDEVASHRIGKLEPIVMHLVGGPAERPSVGGTIPFTVVVAPDGAVVSVTTSEVVDWDDPQIPKEWVPELKKVVAQAEAQIRALRYRPFERDGHAVSATFEERVPSIPPEMSPGPHVDFPEIHDWKSLRMRLERTICMGTCPVYSVEVRGDGTVMYKGDAYVAILGAHRGWVSQQAVLDLLSEFRKADYFSLRDRYESGVTDNPTYTTSIQFDDRSKQVVDYVGLEIGMPASVAELENKIDELADTARWTKGNAATLSSLSDEKWNLKSSEAADALAGVVMQGSADAVCDLVRAGVPLNGHDRSKNTLLEGAAFRGDPDMLNCILQAERRTDSTALSKALSRAAGAGKLEAVKLLLDYGANPDAHPEAGDPPIVAAAASGIPAVVQEILKHRPDIAARGNDGRTALIAGAGAWQWQRDTNKEFNRIEVVRLLLATGAEVDARDNKGNTALIENAWDPEIAILLLDHGANINAANNKGWTPLFSASSPELARTLVEHGASITVRDKKGRTPLQSAREYGNPEIVAVLEAAEAGKRK